MSRPILWPVAMFVVLMMAGQVHASSGNAALIGTAHAGESDDEPDQPASLVAVGDFNHDGIADLVETVSPKGAAGQHFLTILLGQVTGSFKSTAAAIPIGNHPRAMVVGDLNADGNPDVIVGDADGSILELLGDGKGNLPIENTVATVGSVASLAIGHFTRDGNLGLVVSDVQSNSAAILLGMGNGSFRQAWSFELPRRGRAFRIATTDFNHDGIADLVISSDEDTDYEVMLGNGNGTFTYAPALSHVRDPNSYCPS